MKNIFVKKGIEIEKNKLKVFAEFWKKIDLKKYPNHAWQIFQPKWTKMWLIAPVTAVGGDRNRFPTPLETFSVRDFAAFPPRNFIHALDHALNPARSAGKNFRFWGSVRAKSFTKLALPGAAQTCIFAAFSTILMEVSSVARSYGV